MRDYLLRLLFSPITRGTRFKDGGTVGDNLGVIHVLKQAAIGLFITLEQPSRDMLTEATTAGFYKSPGWHMDYPKVQILTIEDLLHGKGPLIPGSQQTFKQAAKAAASDGPEQLGLEME